MAGFVQPWQGVQSGHLAIAMVVVAVRGWQSGPGDWVSTVTVGTDGSVDHEEGLWDWSGQLYSGSS